MAKLGVDKWTGEQHAIVALATMHGGQAVEIARLRKCIGDIDHTLRVGAAEYVPAIRDVFTLIDALLQEYKAAPAAEPIVNRPEVELLRTSIVKLLYHARSGGLDFDPAAPGSDKLRSDMRFTDEEAALLHALNEESKKGPL